MGTISDQIIARLEAGDPYVDVASIGAGAVNQAVKGVAVARERWLQFGRDLVVTPYFSVIAERGQDRTRIVLRVRLE